MKVSVIIPTTPEHAPYLGVLLAALAQGTEKPEQVVVSVSQAPLATADALRVLERLGRDLFDDFIMLRHDGRMRHGPNRQAASERASGDILIYQDADDLPHPQRVQVVKHFFARYDIMHLNHCWIGLDDPFPDYTGPGAAPIRAVTPEAVFQATFPTATEMECLTALRGRGYGFFSGFYVTTGMPAVRRAVLDRVRWKSPEQFMYKRNEDYEFNMNTLFTFRKSMIIDASLVKWDKYKRLQDRIDEQKNG